MKSVTINGISLEEFKKAVATGTRDAARIGEQVIRVHLLGESLLEMRQATIQDFRDEHIDPSLLKRLTRLRDELKETAKSDAKDTGLTLVLKGIEEALGLLLDLALIGRIIKLGVKAYRKLGPQRIAITAGSSTDAMLLLRQDLKGQVDVLEKLGGFCTEAMADIDRVVKSVG